MSSFLIILILCLPGSTMENVIFLSLKLGLQVFVSSNRVRFCTKALPG